VYDERDGVAGPSVENPVGGCSVVDIYGLDTAFRLRSGTRYRFKDPEERAIIMMALLLLPSSGPGALLPWTTA
jgi:hypothetical protein